MITHEDLGLYCKINDLFSKRLCSAEVVNYVLKDVDWLCTVS